MPLREGSRLGSYIVGARIGIGGMGEVYRARDTQLDRDVALKTVPDEFLCDADRLARFLREAKVLASLSHPNIAQIYGLEQSGTTPCIVMELLQGETLRARIARGPLSPGKVVEVAIAVAEALAAVHSKNITHRDLKPENIFLTADGRIKILDFGLARWQPPASDADSTMTRAGSESGVMMGTIGYMSPEQVRGEKAEATSDIFSLGCVVYEMLTARRAFERDTAADMLAAILKEQPQPLDGSVSHFGRVIDHCLEKHPRDRFQSARDLIFALESLEKRPGTSTRLGHPHASHSIAVLPFRNMGGDPEQTYFCEGIAEELINALTKIDGLQVASRTSAFRFQGQLLDVREIGTALNVSTILEGSVRMAGRRLRVVAELTNVGDGYHLWSERYERELEDVFAIQDEIVESIVRALRVRLGPSDVPAAARRHSTNVAAYQDYLRGLNYWYRREADSIKRAAYFFEQAVQHDPNYVLAHAGVAESYASLGWYGLRPDEARTKSRAALSRALALDDTLAEVHAAAGLCNVWFEWDWPGAEQALRTATELEPTHTRAKCWFAFLRMVQGRPHEAYTFAREAQALEPVSPYVSAILVHALTLVGRHTEALGEIERARDLAPDSLHVLWSSGAAYVRAGLPDQAVAVLERAATLANRDTYYLGWLGWAYAMAHRRELAESTLDELLARAPTMYVAPVFRAWILGALGRIDDAFDLLEQGYQERSPLLPWLVYPVYDSLRHDARLQDLSRRMKL
jgi:serine/threonine protein kinase/Tfp pilus assembly protein PilF